MNSVCDYMDLSTKGRDEADQQPTMSWLRRHDEYEDSLGSQDYDS